MKPNQKNFRTTLWAMLLIGSFSFVGCAVEDETTATQPDEYVKLAGTLWQDAYGYKLAFEAKTIDQPDTSGLLHVLLDVIEVDIANQIIKVKRNRMNYDTNGDTMYDDPSILNTIEYGRYRWYVHTNGKLYWCTEVYGKATLDELNADTTAYPVNKDNPASSACGVSTYSEYTKQ